MPCAAAHALRDLDGLIAQLDEQAALEESRGTSAHKHWTARRHKRYAYRVDCKVRIYCAGAERPIELPGRTRNLSCGGVGLLIRRVFVVNEPVEVEIPRRGQPTLFMVGLVRFCRYVGQGYHEIGVELRKAGNAPIFPKTFSGAQEILKWLQ